MSSINPMGVHVTSFRAPTEKERAHDYLWRVHERLRISSDPVVGADAVHIDVRAIAGHQAASPRCWRT